MPFLWYVGLEGTIHRPPKPTNLPEIEPVFDVNVGFKELRSSIKFAIMLSSEYKTGRMVLKLNFFSLILESNLITPYELILQNTILKMYYFGGDAAIGYRIFRKPNLEIDGMVGFKLNSIKISGRTDVIGFIRFEDERQDVWFDPMLALRARYFPVERIEISVYGDAGLLIGDNINYQYYGEVFFHVTKAFYVSLGYKSWTFIVPEEEAIYNGSIKGWISKIGFQF
jgi:hypothetical protein